MFTLPDAIVPVLGPFTRLFTNPTWSKAQLLLVGTILATGQRIVVAFDINLAAPFGIGIAGIIIFRT